MKRSIFASLCLICLMGFVSCEKILDDIFWALAWDKWYGITIWSPSGLRFNAILDWYPVDGEITEDSCAFSFYQIHEGENPRVTFLDERKYSEIIKDSAHVYILDDEGSRSIFKNCIVSKERLNKFSSEYILARMTIYREQLDRKGNGDFTYPPKDGDGVRVEYYQH